MNSLQQKTYVTPPSNTRPINAPPVQKSFMYELVDERTYLTENGDVIKNLQGIEKLGIRMYRKVVLQFYSWKIYSELRRRFNLAMKMYVTAAYRHRVKSNVREALKNLRTQTELLEGKLIGLEPDVLKRQLDFYGDKLPFILPRDGFPLLMAFIKADKLLGILDQAYKTGEIDDDLLKLKIPLEAAVSSALTEMIGVRKLKEHADSKCSLAALLKPKEDLY